MKTLKGVFKPQNPKKYKGDPTNIIYRSSWERRMMQYLDDNPKILQWSSEELSIPYISPVDGRAHRYFPDFIVTAGTPKGTKTMILEVKPLSQTKEPKIRKKTKQYLYEVSTYGVNQAKWTAARKYCDQRGWEFSLITEKDLGLAK